MITKDEKIRNALNDALTSHKIDVRNLAIEVVDGDMIVKGTVPSAEQKEQIARLLHQCLAKRASLEFDVSIKEVAPSDSLDGRGRSPVTGTSADSAHESRRQLDRT
jgi:hypothetical protein